MCEFSVMHVSGRDSKLIICNSPCYATEDRCQQCELYYYYYYYYYYLYSTTTPLKQWILIFRGQFSNVTCVKLYVQLLNVV